VLVAGASFAGVAQDDAALQSSIALVEPPVAECPAAAAVERRLSALRAPDAVALWYRVDVQRSGDAFTLKAVTASGETFLQRSLPAAGPCEELEQAAAVVLLAWEAQLPPGEVPAPSPSPALVEKQEAAAPAPAPVNERLRVSAQGAAWLSGVAPVGGGGATVEWRPTRLPLALSFDVFGQGQRTIPLAGGTGTWSRLSFALGVTGTVNLDPRVSLTFGLGGVGGPFWVNGAGYQTSNNHLLDFDAGLMARALLYLPGLWRIRPYVGADAVLWLRRHQIVAQGSNAGQQVLPDIEVAPCAGLAWTL
jgi:hypothetical protein